MWFLKVIELINWKFEFVPLLWPIKTIPLWILIFEPPPQNVNYNFFVQDA